MFSVRGFESLFPCAGNLGCEVCLAPQLFLLVYLHSNVGLPSRKSPPGWVCQQSPCLPQSSSCCLAESLSTQLPVSGTPTSLNECFCFNSSVVIFHTVQFSVSSGGFLLLNLLLSFFWLCEEAQCVYLRLHLGWKSLMSF